MQGSMAAKSDLAGMLQLRMRYMVVHNPSLLVNPYPA